MQSRRRGTVLRTLGTVTSRRLCARHAVGRSDSLCVPEVLGHHRPTDRVRGGHASHEVTGRGLGTAVCSRRAARNTLARQREVLCHGAGLQARVALSWSDTRPEVSAARGLHLAERREKKIFRVVTTAKKRKSVLVKERMVGWSWVCRCVRCVRVCAVVAVPSVDGSASSAVCVRACGPNGCNPPSR